MRLQASRITFVVDFDGTIAPLDTVDSLLDTFADPTWEAIENQWVQGDINSRTCLKRQLDLIFAARSALDAFFDAIRIDPTFPEFVRYASTFAHLAVVSDGLDYPITQVLQKAGLASLPVFANKMDFTDTGLAISFPHSSKTCVCQSGVCKCAVARALGGDLVILIGDGMSDQCLAQDADYVFAKGSLARFCDTTGIPFTPFTSFADVLANVQRWDQTQFVATPRVRHA